MSETYGYGNPVAPSVRNARYRVKARIFDAGFMGRTVQELRTTLPGMHHGQISSALSNLHKDGDIACLTVKRSGCHVYVDKDMVRGRETKAHGRRQGKAEYAVEQVLDQAKAMAALDHRHEQTNSRATGFGTAHVTIDTSARCVACRGQQIVDTIERSMK